jgi:hypothetical protein
MNHNYSTTDKDPTTNTPHIGTYRSTHVVREGGGVEREMNGYKIQILQAVNKVSNNQMIIFHTLDKQT